MCGERNEDGRAAGGQSSLNFDLTVSQRQAAHQPLLLLVVQSAQVAVVLLCNTGCLKNVVFQLLPVSYTHLDVYKRQSLRFPVG